MGTSTYLASENSTKLFGQYHMESARYYEQANEVKELSDSIDLQGFFFIYNRLMPKCCQHYVDRNINQFRHKTTAFYCLSGAKFKIKYQCTPFENDLSSTYNGDNHIA